MHRWLHDEVFTFASLNGIYSPSFHSFSFIIPLCIHFFLKLWFFFSSFHALHCTPSTVSSTFFFPGVGWLLTQGKSRIFHNNFLQHTETSPEQQQREPTISFFVLISLPSFSIFTLSLSSLLILTKLSLTHSITGFYEVFVMLARLFSCSPFKSLSVVLQMYTIKSFLSYSPFLGTFLWLLIALLSVNDERTFCSRRKKLELIRIQR